MTRLLHMAARWNEGILVFLQFLCVSTIAMENGQFWGQSTEVYMNNGLTIFLRRHDWDKSQSLLRKYTWLQKKENRFFFEDINHTK